MSILNMTLLSILNMRKFCSKWMMSHGPHDTPKSDDSHHVGPSTTPSTARCGACICRCLQQRPVMQLAHPFIPLSRRRQFSMIHVRRQLKATSNSYGLHSGGCPNSTQAAALATKSPCAAGYQPHSTMQYLSSYRAK